MRFETFQVGEIVAEIDHFRKRIYFYLDEQHELKSEDSAEMSNYIMDRQADGFQCFHLQPLDVTKS